MSVTSTKVGFASTQLLNLLRNYFIFFRVIDCHLKLKVSSAQNLLDTANACICDITLPRQ